MVPYFRKPVNTQDTHILTRFDLPFFESKCLKYTMDEIKNTSVSRYPQLLMKSFIVV